MDENMGNVYFKGLFLIYRKFRSINIANNFVEISVIIMGIF